MELDIEGSLEIRDNESADLNKLTSILSELSQKLENVKDLSQPRENYYLKFSHKNGKRG